MRLGAGAVTVLLLLLLVVVAMPQRAVHATRHDALAGVHPLPRWEPTFNMSLSTIIMPCEYDKFITDPTIRKFGVVDLDWSNSKALWVNEKPMQCEENLVKQATIMKAETPLSKVWVYRDPVLAMPWFTTVRKIMDDEDYRPWFLKFKNGTDGRGPLAHDGDGTYHHPVCDHNYDPPKCSDLFHSQTQTPGYPKGDGDCEEACDCGRVPCGMYLFDHRSKAVVNGQSFVDWLVHNLTVSPTGLLHPAIDGFFMDDTWSDDGFGIGHPGAGDLNGSEVQDIGLTHQDLADLQGNWSANMQVVKDAIVSHDGFLWQDMVCVGDDGATPVKCEGYNGTQAGPPITRGSCATRLRQACQQGSVYQTGALFYGFKDQGNRGPTTVPLEDFGNDLGEPLVLYRTFV